jgi:uncharacterized membrane protein
LRPSAAGRGRCALGAAALAAALAGGPAGRARAAEIDVGSPWTLAFYKTLSYQVAANAYDLLVYEALAGATAAPLGTFFLANLAADSAVYYAHEVTWLHAVTMPAGTVSALEVELAKTVTFRAVSTAGHVAVFYLLSGDPLAALGFGLASNLGQVAIYLANEEAWRPALQSRPTRAAP